MLYKMLHLQDVQFQELKARNYDHGVYYDGIVIAYNTDMYGLITDNIFDVV